MSENMELFETKDNDKIGTTANPIMVAGRKGLEEYFNSLVSNKTSNKIIYKRTSTIYLTDEKTNLDYAIDEYTLLDAETEEELDKVWVNIYGIENTNLCLKGYSFKIGESEK